jgi:hypothetical protein
MKHRACIFQEVVSLSEKKKQLGSGSRPTLFFFCRPYYFFNAIDRATLFSDRPTDPKAAAILLLSLPTLPLIVRYSFLTHLVCVEPSLVRG